ncbi:MAG: RNHCP domain-containing protein [Micromonosporaceae bacterium]
MPLPHQRDGLGEAGTPTKRASRNTAFTCLFCAAAVPACTNGSFRNHCPFCLWSCHVDLRPGDRASGCGGPMEPVGLTRPRGKDWALVHRCVICGEQRTNRLARDTDAPDDVDAVVRLPPA